MNCLFLQLFSCKWRSVFLQNLLRFINNSVDFGLFLSTGRFGKMFWAAKTKSSILGSETKKIWIWMDFYRSSKSNMNRSLFFHPLFFGEMVLSCFPNCGSMIMINTVVIDLLYDLEMGFHFLFSLTNQIRVVFLG